MKERDKKREQHASRPPRKGYEPPRIVFRETLEGVASVCPTGPPILGKAAGACLTPNT
jgi:hypothetical protein